MYGFVINFQIGATKKIFPRGCVFDKREHILHGAGDDTGFIFISSQSVCLPGGSLTVRKDDGVVPFHCCMHVGPGNGRVDRFVGGSGKDGVEVECIGICAGIGGERWIARERGVK